ncbi:MAG: hypothetical protein IJH59_09400 [Firmicutes bacterium]|nr:hypothetical protein [Bacillota bacterium]
MKKLLVLAALILLLCLAACGGAPQEEEIANPWHDITEEEAAELCPASFALPEGAENASWSVMDAEEGASPLVQLSFDLDGNSFIAREQLTEDAGADISGMYYDWTAQLDDTLQNWGGLACHSYRHVGDDGYADLCAWYDEARGVSYTLSVTAEDLEGFDLLAVAEALAPAK